MTTYDDVRAAAARIAGRVRTTPVVDVEIARNGSALPTAVTLKLECLQHTGSFKPRGAFNRLLSATIPGSGVIAASGGNHGLAVAYAAGRLGVRAEVFVPESSSPVKVAGLRSYGAEVVVTGAYYADAYDACLKRREETGALLVHAYDQPEVVAGQGSTGLELLAQVPDVDTVVVAVGGGGLAGGIRIALDGGSERSVRLVAVEPERAPTLHAALDAGRAVEVEVGGVAADSLGARRIGDIALGALGPASTGSTRSVLVPDDAIGEARRWLWRELRLATEPGGAAAVAALLCGAYRPAPGERVCAIVCGANADPCGLADG